MAKDKKFDDIFESTEPAAAKKAPARKAARPEDDAPAPAKPVADLAIDKFAALNSALTAHHEEVLQRKAREDRYLFWSTGLTAAFLVFVAFGALYGGHSASWMVRILVRLLLAGGAIGNLVFTTGVLESNRRKMRDLMGVVVKLNDRLGFFTPGMYDESEESFYPNTYKFAGSEAEDETNKKALFLKGMTAVAVLVILFLA